MICPDCNGRGRYLCCNGFVEECNNCLSTGVIASEATKRMAGVLGCQFTAKPRQQDGK